MVNRLKSIRARFSSELNVYRLILGDPGTPRAAKWLLGAAIAYAISPIDLIPDFIPVLGYLDDVVIVPALIMLALKLVPQEVVDDCRRRAKDSK
jgi:uncharacterized membrane protein YkvA (DUF1232 family)